MTPLMCVQFSPGPCRGLFVAKLFSDVLIRSALRAGDRGGSLGEKTLVLILGILRKAMPKLCHA